MPVLSEVRLPSPADAAAGRAAPARLPLDLVLFGALLVPTAMFGRDFAKIEVPGTPVYITEVMLLAIAALAVRRHGVARSWALIRDRVPIVALGVFLLAGAVAAARGLAGYGFENVTRDIGLVLYAVVVPIAVLVVDDRRRLSLIVKVMVFAGTAAVALWTVAYLGSVLFDVQDLPRPRGGSAAGLYMSLPVLWAAARWAYGLPLRAIELAVALVGLVAIGLTDQRGNWLAVVVGLGALALMAPAGRRLRTSVAVAGAVAFMAAGTGVVEWAAAERGATPSHQAAEPAQTAPQPRRGVQAVDEIRGIAGGQSSEGSNADWRLAIWKYSLDRMVDSPLGITLGQPLRFVWNDRYYDFRTGDPNDGLDVTGPHNSFVEVGARMGVAGLVALIALLAVAAYRGITLLRDSAVRSADRYLAAALLAMTATTVVISLLNDALKGPYHAVFFWLLLALLLIAPAVLRPAAADSAER
jgi:hypothetical protein